MTTGESPSDHRGLGHLLVEDHRWAMRLAIVLWVAAGALFLAMAIPPLRDITDSIDLWFYELTFPIKWAPLTGLALLLNFLGGGFFAWPFRVAITIVLAVQRRWEGLAAWVLAIILTEPFIGLLKFAYGRSRPPEGLVTATSGSFPSGHAITGAVTAIALVIAFVPAGPRRRNLELLAAVFAFLMGASRVYLGVHWPTDVVAGVAFGAATAIAAAVLVHRYFLRRVPRSSQAGDDAPLIP